MYTFQTEKRKPGFKIAKDYKRKTAPKYFLYNGLNPLLKVCPFYVVSEFFECTPRFDPPPATPSIPPLHQTDLFSPKMFVFENLFNAKRYQHIRKLLINIF